MLHLRQKAEIEVLTSTNTNLNLSCDFANITNLDDDKEERQTAQNRTPYPLIQYLIMKINDICSVLQTAYNDEPMSDEGLPIEHSRST